MPYEKHYVYTLTGLEVTSLDSVGNLADAHTHQAASTSQRREIVSRLPQIFNRAASLRQAETDHEVAWEYHSLAGQASFDKVTVTFPCYSSSLAFEIVCNYMRLSGSRRLALCEPTFDNLADTAMRHGLELQPILDAGSWYESCIDILHNNYVDSLALVIPNNPTGSTMSRVELHEIARLAAKQDIFLIVDASFRVFDERACFDFYDTLRAASCFHFVIVEDTGKIWPALDTKVAFLNSSLHAAPQIGKIHEDMLLNVSPFANLVIAEFCRLSKIDSLASVRSLLAQNRTTMEALVYARGLATPANDASKVSVEFIELSADLSAHELSANLRSKYGVHILPGGPFFWSNSRPEADRFVRVALSRDADVFERAVRALANGLRNYRKDGPAGATK